MGKKKSLILALILCLLVLAGCEPDPPVQYTITYHVLDGASNPSSNPSSYTVETSTIQLADPSRTGYTFAGWYSSASYTGEAITHIPQGSSGPKHLYAKWTGNTYTVSFDSNDQAIQNPDPQDLIFGQAYASLPTLTKAYYGHTWNTVQNGSGTTITNATTLSTAQNHTLYAQWTPTQYTITYTLNEGQNSSSNPATYTVETSTITLADPSRDGYSFASWYTEAAFTTQVTTIAQGSHDNLTLHAKWTANSYTVSFDSQDSQLADPGAQNIAFGQTYAS
ncbi:MAG: InlB B-repeat-containing protein, partial [Sphaerochaeta sp.]|nr:InlB B-repeat-containing protein [Sphaerochaeta sp.]